MGSASAYTPEHEREAAALARKGWTHQRIAEHQGVARETVSRHLAALHRKARADLVADQSAILGEQAEQTRELIAQAVAEWRRSRRGAEAKPDPRLLKEIRELMAAYREMAGIASANRVAGLDLDGGAGGLKITVHYADPAEPTTGLDRPDAPPAAPGPDAGDA